MTAVFESSTRVPLIFLAVITMLQTIQASCIHKENVTRMWRKIETPAFPSPFPATTQCSWSLTSPRTYRIKIQFTQFSLMPPNKDGDCKFQWLSVINGRSTSAGEKNAYTLCGKHSPGTLVTTGRFLQIYLHSTPAASGQKYIGFQASLTTTQEKPLLPGLNVDSIMQNESKKKKKPVRTRETLGSVLNRIRPPSRPVVLTQSQKIEEMNRRRNLGIPVRENPVYDANGNVIEGLQSTKKKKVTTTRPIVIQNVPSKKRGPTLSNEIKTVLIVIGIISLCFGLLLLIKKCGFLQRILKWRKRNESEDEESSVENLNYTKDGNFIKNNLSKQTEGQKRNVSSKIANKEHNNFKNENSGKFNQVGKNYNNTCFRSYPANKVSKAQQIKRTISKKAGVRRTYHHQIHHEKQMKRNSEQKIADCNIRKKDPGKVNTRRRDPSHFPAQVVSTKTTAHSRSRQSKSLQKQLPTKSMKDGSNSDKHRGKTRNTKSYRNQAYNKSGCKSESFDSQSPQTRFSKKSKSNRNRARNSRQSNKARKKVQACSSSEDSDVITTSSYDSTSSDSSFEMRSKPIRR